MKALVVYESMFGNTEQVARAIGAGLSRHGEVETVEVSQAPAAPAVPDLLVVGGPTHAFSMTRPKTRAEAVERGATQGSQTTGIREWLDALPAGPHHERMATFDTRVEKVRKLPGSAAKSAARAAHRHGYPSAHRPESFYVADVDGPLLEGELERAEAWGDELGASVAAKAGHG